MLFLYTFVPMFFPCCLIFEAQTSSFSDTIHFQFPNYYYLLHFYFFSRISSSAYIHQSVASSGLRSLDFSNQDFSLCSWKSNFHVPLINFAPNINDNVFVLLSSNTGIITSKGPSCQIIIIYFSILVKDWILHLTDSTTMVHEAETSAITYDLRQPHCIQLRTPWGPRTLFWLHSHKLCFTIH